MSFQQFCSSIREERYLQYVLIILVVIIILILENSPRNNEFLVSKETVVLRRWERSKQKFGIIKRVDKG